MLLDDSPKLLMGLKKPGPDVFKLCGFVNFVDVQVECRGIFPGITGCRHSRLFSCHAGGIPFEHHELPVIQMGQHIPDISVEGAWRKFFVFIG